MTFRIGSSLPLNGLDFSGEHFMGDLSSGLQSDAAEFLPSLKNLFIGEGELAMLRAYSRALLRGESMICSPDSLSILALSARFFLLSISF